MLLLMALGVGFSAAMPLTDRWNKSYFITLFSMLFLCTVVLLVDCIFWENPAMANVEKVIWFMEFFLLSVLIWMSTLFLLHSCGESIKDSLLFKAVTALWGVYCAILIAAQFTDVFYRTTSDGECLRGPLFAVLLLPLAVMMLLNIVGTLRRRSKIPRRYFIAQLIYILPMTAAVCLHMFVFASILIVFAMALCALIMFGLIISDNVIQYARQQREIANQRANIMVLQMRPHFISNTMMGIYYLCDQDPQKAKQVTLDFTTYLRRNFTALTSEDTVPFTAEMEHTRAYLAVEQAQFEDSLFVAFDTPHTTFRVPPLTLQPIVENAVKHGLCGSNKPIHISIFTRQTDKASEIIVEDDGPGFNPVEDDEPHIGLENIRQRLGLMCSGTLTITPREGGGTRVTVTVPTTGR
ncbi:MAG: histidine kinase [Clostridia bacterium]|nr:histidine kinase [Clostridia bacterium]